MIKFIKYITILLSDIGTTKFLLSARFGGYLNDIGWFSAYKSRQSVDKNLNPIPWMTYSSIDFLDQRLTKNMRLFEYGSGNSTLYYSNKCKEVASVEHDESWYSKTNYNLPSNVKLIFQKLDNEGSYSKIISKQESLFDVVIIDGRERVKCISESLAKLAEQGVVVLDDSERDCYQNGIKILKKNGFKNIVFSGISPGTFYYKRTTIFYKQNNCLGI